MKRSRFTEYKIIEVLRHHTAGAKPPEQCRWRVVGQATLYNWNSRYEGLTVSVARRLRQLEEENRKLTELVSESMLGITALKDTATGNI